MMTTTKNFKPVLFSTEMVQALLEGRKTQTRRIVKLPVTENEKWGGGAFIEHKSGERTAVDSPGNLPSPIKKGDILWVRETWCPTGSEEYLHKETGRPYFYKADVKDLKAIKETMQEFGYKWKPSIFMPKAACRIFLEVTNVRLERLNQISQNDRACEGLPQNSGLNDWKELWIDVHGPVKGYGTWKANSWVWVYEFKRVEKPENFLL